MLWNLSYPLRGVNVALHGFVGLKRAKALWTNRDLNLKETKLGVTFTLPVLQEYEVVALGPLTKAP